MSSDQELTGRTWFKSVLDAYIVRLQSDFTFVFIETIRSCIMEKMIKPEV